MDTPEFALILLVVIIVVFVLLREFFCWYFKINQRSEQNEKIIKLLAKQIELKKIEMGIIKTEDSQDDRAFMNT